MMLAVINKFDYDVNNPFSSTLGLDDSTRCNFYCANSMIFLYRGCINQTELGESHETLVCACYRDYCNRIECSREAFEVFGPYEILSKYVI